MLKVNRGGRLACKADGRWTHRAFVAGVDGLSLFARLRRAVILLQRLDHEAPALEAEAELTARANDRQSGRGRDERADRGHDADVDQARVAREGGAELRRVCAVRQTIRVDVLEKPLSSMTASTQRSTLLTKARPLAVDR